jgi:hypothetical protein
MLSGLSLPQPLTDGSDDYHRGERLRRNMLIHAENGEFDLVAHHLKQHPKDANFTLAGTGDTLLHLIARETQEFTLTTQVVEGIMCCVDVILTSDSSMVMATNTQMNTPLFILMKGYFHEDENSETMLQLIRLFLSACPEAATTHFNCLQTYLVMHPRRNMIVPADYEEMHCVNHFIAAVMNQELPDDIIRDMLEREPKLAVTSWGTVLVHRDDRFGKSDEEVYQEASERMRLVRNPMDAIIHGASSMVERMTSMKDCLHGVL